MAEPNVGFAIRRLYMSATASVVSEIRKCDKFKTCV